MYYTIPNLYLSITIYNTPLSITTYLIILCAYVINVNKSIIIIARQCRLLGIYIYSIITNLLQTV